MTYLPIAHLSCPRELQDRMAAMGVEITVSEQAPLVDGPYTTDGFTCPHGVTYWIEPTGEQIAKWAANGTA